MHPAPPEQGKDLQLHLLELFAVIKKSRIIICIHSIQGAKRVTREVPKVGGFLCFLRGFCESSLRNVNAAALNVVPVRERLISRALFPGQSDICRLILYLE